MAVSNVKVFSVVMELQQVVPCALLVYHQFNIHNCAFCPHSVFVCFVWI